jgi:coenzyme PQQ precursor peptide PqqA
MDRAPKSGQKHKNQFGGHAMTWTTPRVIEISVGMEINCYACADI